jgi:hypothetical protein
VSERQVRLATAVALVVLAVPFLVPVLRPGWIQSHEGLSYPVRQAQLWICWQDGLWSARWFPHLNWGQGYAFLSFYAPMTFWLAGMGQLLGLGPAAALKIPLVLSTLVGVAGTYRLARLAVGRPAAFGAAALFLYAPYRVRDVFIRGDVAEILALGVLPWALFAVLRLAARRRPRHVALVVGTGAAAILSHNILGMLTGVCMALAAVVALATSPARRATAVALAIGGVGALAVTAFFWLPALVEKDLVRIEDMLDDTLDYRRNFVAPARLIARGELPGTGQGLPMSFELGWPVLALLVLGGAAGAFRARRGAGDDAPPDFRRPVLVVGLLLFVGGVFLLTEASRFLYEALPLLRFLQFPWRFLAVASTGAALLGGLALEELLRLPAPRFGWLRPVAAAVVAGLAVLFVLPLLGPRANFPVPSWALDPAELSTMRETTSSDDEYLPRFVTRSMDPGRALRDGWELDGDGEVHDAVRRAGRWDLRVSARGPVEITLIDQDFPGWEVRADGERVPHGHVPERGNLRFSLPPGEHEVTARLEPTPIRRAAAAGSVVAALMLAGLGGFAARRERRS